MGTSRAEDVRAYRVEYQGAVGDGYLIIHTDTSTTRDLVSRAHDRLEQQGINARIRRIIPVGRAAAGTRPRATGLVRSIR